MRGQDGKIALRCRWRLTAEPVFGKRSIGLQEERDTTASQGMAILDCRQKRASRKMTRRRERRRMKRTRPLHSRFWQVQPPNPLQNHIVCGKTPAYPQRQMCRSRFFAGQSVFVQDRFKLDTMLFQLIRQHVNR